LFFHPEFWLLFKTFPLTLPRMTIIRKARASFLLTVAPLLLSLTLSAANKTDDANLTWTDIRDLDVEGRGWTDTKAFFDRLPAKAESVVRGPVWSLSRCSSGMLVRFVTDARQIHARWTLNSKNLEMRHMPATGVSGLDLYVRTSPREWRWLGVGQPNAESNSVQLVSGLPAGTNREFLLYLPLYNGVRTVELGVPPGAAVAKAGPWGPGTRKPIVFCGTSIQQGGCASRPGMVHSSILGRRFNWPTINLGFSGNGRMEPELADLLAELDPVVYVIDCLPNMTSEEVGARVEPFVRRLRQAHPATPIVLVEDRTYSNSYLIPGHQKRQAESRAALKAGWQRLKRSGVKNLSYLRGEDLLGGDSEGTVDGSHPSDLGFMRQADAFAKVLRPLLKY
jgi:hypothetical protein